MATTSPSTKAPADSTTAPAAPTEQEVNTRSTAFNHFSQGKRHLLVGDFKSAVSAFKEATVALAELYGEQAPECGDAYYHYGRALLELARKEAGVLGGDLDGGSSQEGSTGEEEDDDEEESEESQEEEDGEKKEEGGDNEEEEEGKEEAADGKKKAKKEGEGAEEGEGENTEEEEEVSTLQCAWEWLDVARVIFDKQDETPEISKKRAQIRLSLGEVCMESEDYEGAISEFQKCLAIQGEVLEKDDRCLAETHYQLGLGHCFSDNFDDAVTHFKAAVEVIQLKIKNLKARVEEKNTWSKERKEKELAESKDVFYTEEGEIEDLEQLLPDIQHKIVDMEEMKAASAERFQQVAAKALLLGRGEIAGSSGSSGTSSSAAATSAAASASVSASASVFSQARDSEEVSPSKASDAKQLSTLQVRRKRKPEEEEASEEKKKQRLENGVKSEAEGEASKPSTNTSNATPAKPIAIKRKVVQNGKDASESPSKQSESSSKTESSSSAPSLPTPQDVK